MKLTCPFCQTEYSVAAKPKSGGRPQRVQCACCGYVWDIQRRRAGFLLWLAAVCLVLSAAMFVTAAAIKYWPGSNRGSTAGWKSTAEKIVSAKLAGQKRAPASPLALALVSVQVVSGETGEKYWVISGTIKNNSGKIYGVPDMIISIRNESGEQIVSQKFPAPASLLDIGESVEYKYFMAANVPDAKNFAIEFAR